MFLENPGPSGSFLQCTNPMLRQPEALLRNMSALSRNPFSPCAARYLIEMIARLAVGNWKRPHKQPEVFQDYAERRSIRPQGKLKVDVPQVEMTVHLQGVIAQKSPMLDCIMQVLHPL
jgi:hypothetical protein